MLAYYIVLQKSRQCDIGGGIDIEIYEVEKKS